MKKILYIFLILSSSALYSQWSWLNPTPQGNYLKQVILLTNGNIIAGGNCGTITVSTNNASSWFVTHRINDTTAAINSLFRINDNLIFAGSNDSRIFRSTNGGLNWLQISRIAPQSSFNIKLYFVDSQFGFAYFQFAFYKTSNGGFNWSFASQYQQQLGDYWFIDANTGFAAGGAIVDNQFVTWCNKTTNSGVNWSALNVPDIGPVSKVQFINSSTGFLAGFNNIYKTTNSGSNWFIINPVNTFSRINYFYFFSESIAYVGTYNSYFFKTTNGGANWSSMLIPYYTFNSYYGINNFSFTDQQNGSSLIHNHIVVKTTNAGINWSLHTNSFNLYTPLKAIEFLDNNTAILGGWGTTNDFVLQKTTNGGLNWLGLVPYNYQNASGYIYDIDFTSALTGYAVGGGGSKGYVYKTINAGNNWIKMDSIASGTLYSCFFLNDNTGYAPGNNGEIFKTTNGAVSWSTYLSGISFRLNSIYFTDINTGFACGGNATQVILKTTNSGLNWIQINTTTGNTYSYLNFINSSTGFLSAKGIYKTTDAGVSWLQKTPNNLIYFYKTDFPSTNTGYAIAAYGIIYKTTDSGENWGELYSPTDNFFADLYFLNDNTGYLIGDQGLILKTTNGGGNFVIGINDPIINLPTEYKLFQNYPNPFNPATTIRFFLPENCFVLLKIYDILGKEVIVLTNSYVNSGEHEVSWDASNYPSGVYFYRMTVDGKSFEKKMVLIK